MSTTKMLPCSACCPAHPELGQRRAGKARHEYEFIWDEEKQVHVWGWRCWNCGNFKPIRKRKARPTYEEIISTFTSEEKLFHQEKVWFHCFNPNGLYAQLKAMNDRVSKWVDEHPDRPNGVLMVHGSLHDFPRKTLFDLLEKGKKITRMGYTVGINIVRRAIEDGNDWLEKNK